MKKLAPLLLLFSTIILFRQNTIGQNNHTLYFPIVQKPQPPPSVTFEFVARGVADIHTDIETRSDGTIYIATQEGTVSHLKPDGTLETPAFLDIRALVEADRSETGFFDIAFHPDYANNQQFFVSYYHRDPISGKAYVRVSRFLALNDSSADPNSETILLEIEQARHHHQGGTLVFSPLDGYLYIAVGDDGVPSNAQNGSTLNGKILRIDVDSAESPALYAIPTDNPFVDDPTIRDEIWAMGLRNPWAIYFDSATGDLYIPDVGQETMEELNYQPFDAGGGQNYGWPCYEGTIMSQSDECESIVGYTPPIHVYKHENGRCSIAGGLVYHGSELPDLQGKYLFSDFCTYEIFSIEFIEDHWYSERIGYSRRFITKFGTDASGEILLSYFVQDIIDKLIPISPE